MGQKSKSNKSLVFKSGKNGYRCYRIPAIIKAPHGDLIAFAEGRNNGFFGCTDFENNDLVMKRSKDNGQTWKNLKNITTQISKPYQPQLNPNYNFKEDWRNLAIQPGHAIQIKKGESTSFAFYSDNHRKSWKYGKATFPGTNECSVVENAQGQIIMAPRLIARDYVGISTSPNGGTSWDSYRVEKDLINPGCEVSTLSVKHNKSNLILLSSPFSKKKRTNLRISVSTDNGKSWKVGPFLDDKASYSDLVQSQNGKVGILYEKVGRVLQFKIKGIYYRSFGLDEF